MRLRIEPFAAHGVALGTRAARGFTGITSCQRTYRSSYNLPHVFGSVHVLHLLVLKLVAVQVEPRAYLLEVCIYM